MYGGASNVSNSAAVFFLVFLICITMNEAGCSFRLGLVRIVSVYHPFPSAKVVTLASGYNKRTVGGQKQHACAP